MKITKLELETVCGISSNLPVNRLIEVAFWGRSNVGKSSLLNCIWGRKNMARTSSEPGKTQTINYYNVNDEMYMVDLPGYGYAKTSRKTVSRWMSMITNYLESSEALRVVVLLIDSRHEPTDKDIENFRLLYRLGFNPLIIATKVDKLKKNEKAKHIRVIRDTLTSSIPNEYKTDDSTDIPIVPFSATTKEGLEEVLEYMDFFKSNIMI